MYKQLIYLLFGLVITILGFGILIVSSNGLIALAIVLILWGHNIDNSIK